MNRLEEINSQIKIAQKTVADLEDQKRKTEKHLAELMHRREYLLTQSNSKTIQSTQQSQINNHSSDNEKIALFRSFFDGRVDVFAKRFESVKTGKSGYQPCCRNEWVPVICKKPSIKCSDCDNRDFLPVDDEVIKGHLLGTEPYKQSARDFTMGVYPMLTDETCRFLAVDFDKESWIQDAAGFMETCKNKNISVALERSRSGQGGHVWIFFSEPIEAAVARKLGTLLITETMERRPEIGLDSYDRFFPSQDTLPQGGFGNLIALPLQKKPREKGNTLFLDENNFPYDDQWAYLSSIRRMSPHEVKELVNAALQQGDITGVKTVVTEEDQLLPWQEPPSRQLREKPIRGPLPVKVQLVLGNQIYIEKQTITPALRNRLIRIPGNPGTPYWF